MEDKKKINPTGDSLKEQNEKLKEMNYPEKEDIYNQEDHIPLDANGNPLNDSNKRDTIDMGLDVPGSEYDNNMEDIGKEDEENNYYSGADQD
ncbi:MAG: hypothetical protein ACR2MS_01260 [Weeksellaceae bacterium]